MSDTGDGLRHDLFAVVLQSIDDFERIVIVPAETDGAVVTHEERFAGGVRRDDGVHRVLQLAGGGHAVFRIGNDRAEDRFGLSGDRNVSAGDAHRGSGDLMRVDDEIHFRMMFVGSGVDPFFRRGLQAVLIVLEFIDGDLDDVVRCQLLVRDAAGGDDEYVVRDAGRDIAPGTGNEAALHELEAGLDDQFLSDAFFDGHRITLRLSYFFFGMSSFAQLDMTLSKRPMTSSIISGV